MKCPKCGYANKDSFQLCNLCGEPLPKIAPAGAAGAAAAGVVPHTQILGSTWSSPRFGVSLRRPNAPGWTLTAGPKDLRRKEALVEIVHLADRYTVSVIPYDWTKAAPGTTLADFARKVLEEEDERKRGRMVLGRGLIAVGGRAGFRVQEDYLDASVGKPTQEISIFVERTSGFLRFLVAQSGIEFEACLPQFQEILDSVKFDPACDPPASWSHAELNLSLSRPSGPEGSEWGWIQDPQVLESRGGGWLVELLNAAAGARVAVRVHDPTTFSPPPGSFPESLVSLVGAWHGAVADLKFLAPPSRLDVGGIAALQFDVAFTDPQRGPLRTRRIVAPHPAVLVELVAEAPADRFDAAAPGFDAILPTLRVPAGGTGIRPPNPWNLPAWGITLGVPDDLRWIPCASPGFLTTEGSVLEFRDLAEPAARLDLRLVKRQAGLDLGMTLGGWALRFERGTKEEDDFRLDARNQIEIDGQAALALDRSWKTPGEGKPRKDRLVCFERKGAMCLLRAVSTPEDFPRVEEAFGRVLRGTKLAVTHHVVSVLDAGTEGKPARLIKRGEGLAKASAPSRAEGPAPGGAEEAKAPASAGPAPSGVEGPAPAERRDAERTGEQGPEGKPGPAKPAAGPDARGAIRPTLETPIDELENALRDNPADTRASVLLALRFLTTQRYEAAADVLRQAVKRMGGGS